MATRPAPLTRRSLLAGAAGALALAACGGDDSGTDSASTTAPSSDGTGTTDQPTGDDLVLGESFDRNRLLIAGIEQRAAYLLFVASGGLLGPDEAPDRLAFDVETEAGENIARLDVDRHGDDIDRAYYPLQLTFPTVGIHRVRTEIDGAALESLVAVNDRTNITVAQVGDPLPAPLTPTTAAPGDTVTLCTQDPVCPFHEASLDATVGTAPVAFLISTPAYCNTAICGPVLETLEAEAPAHAGLTVVHLEVYPFGAPPDARVSPLVTDAFGLSWEPVLFVTDAAGVVTTRLDNVWDRTELLAALATVS